MAKSDGKPEAYRYVLRQSRVTANCLVHLGRLFQRRPRIPASRKGGGNGYHCAKTPPISSPLPFLMPMLAVLDVVPELGFFD